MGKKLKSERLGETNINNYGSKMEIVEYNGTRNIIIKFSDYDKLVKTQYSNFLIGEIIHPYSKRVNGVGYLGEGNYKPSENGKPTVQYRIWKGVLLRCYSEKNRQKNISYRDCTVIEEWHNFQNFAKWYDENYYEINDEKMHLDKDILFKGNKVYSPETCIFVPQRINNQFVKSEATRGDLPIGVIWHKMHKKYRAQCSCNKKRIHLNGGYNTPEEAFYAYKKFKENYIKEVAEEYKDKIPTKLYEALMRYEVEITD